MELAQRRRYAEQADLLLLLDVAEHGDKKAIDKHLKFLREESF